MAPTTRDVRAYDLYLKGRYLWNRRQTKQAIEQFEAAVAIDPEYADAHLGIADSYAVWGFYGGIPSWEAFARARSAAERAQMLAPGTAGVHLSLGIIEHYYGWDIGREERELRSAIELSPRSHEGFSWLALCFSVSGRADEAREIAQQGVAVEPHSANAQTVLAWTRMGVRRFAEVVPELRRAVELDPEAAFPVWSLGFAQLYAGQPADAVATLERGVERTDREQFFQMALLGAALVASGRTPEARALLEEMRDKSRRTYVPPHDLAVLLTALGDRADALAALERAYEERNALLWARLHFPMFDALRSEPRWLAIAQKLARTAPVRGAPVTG